MGQAPKYDVIKKGSKIRIWMNGGMGHHERSAQGITQGHLIIRD